MEEKILEILLTGGPCAGKITALAYLSEKLQDRGFRIFSAPEIATMLINSGVRDISEIAGTNPRLYFQIEKQMVLGCLSLRRLFRGLAEAFKSEGEKCIIIYDRGALDCAAYMASEQFTAILKENGLTFFDVRDSYNAVIHLVTAAKGAEKFYTTANNKARRESLEEARLADDRTLAVWTDYPRLKIIDNSTNFEMKLKRLFQAVCHTIGIPVPLEIERKFLLAGPPKIFDIPSKVNKTSIEQIYLAQTNSDQIVRVRKRSQKDYSVYYKTIKSNVSGRGVANVRRETENFIGAAEYARLAAFQDPVTDIIVKNRYCFVFNNQHFELDEFVAPPRLSSLWLLEIELTEENDRVELPPFLQIEREVTHEPAYTNYELAKKTIDFSSIL